VCNLRGVTRSRTAQKALGQSPRGQEDTKAKHDKVKGDPWIGTKKADVIHTDGLTGSLHFDGGAGTDKLGFDNVPNLGQRIVTIDLDGQIHGGALDGSTITNFENLTVNLGVASPPELDVYGTPGDNTITLTGPGNTGSYNSGGFSADVFDEAGNDTISADGFYDIAIVGSAGDDTINFGTSYRDQSRLGAGHPAVQCRPKRRQRPPFRSRQ
jgi:hypothetical protein